jgi:hypothetical protein
MEDKQTTYPIAVDMPLEVSYDTKTESLILACYQFASGGSGAKMELHFSPQATQQMIRAANWLQTEHGISAEPAETPQNVQ